MKKFTINCDFGGQMAPFTIFIGSPKEGNHPLDNQSKWLSDNRGGTIPGEVMEAVSKLHELAKKNNVSLEELCVYALGTEEEQEALAAEKGLAVEEEPTESASNSEVESVPENVARMDIAESDAEDQVAVDNIAADDMTGEGGHIEDPELEAEEDDKKQ